MSNLDIKNEIYLNNLAVKMRPKIILGIDLDDTLISNKKSYTVSTNKYKIKRSARKYLYNIQDIGVEFHIITSRFKYHDCSNIIKDIENKINVKFASINYTCGKQKGSICEYLKCDYIVDDTPEKVSNCISTIPILFGKRVRHQTFNHIVCETWKDVYNTISLI